MNIVVILCDSFHSVNQNVQKDVTRLCFLNVTFLKKFFKTSSSILNEKVSNFQVAQEDAERKKTMELMIHEARCAFFQLDARLTREIMVPVCVNPTTGQWFGDKMIKIPTPPSHVSDFIEMFNV